MKVHRIHIKDNKVINITLGDTDKKCDYPKDICIVELPENQIDVVIGSTYDGENFYPPTPVVVPVEKTKEQLLEEIILKLEKRISDLEKITNE